MTVDSNVRMPGEMASTNRQLTSAEQAQVIQVMEESAPPNSAATRRPLAKAGEFGRWSDASKAATAAAKSRETAVVEQMKVDGGLKFLLRNIRDESGTMTVYGNEKDGVTDVVVVMGYFDELQSESSKLRESFWKELSVYGGILRPQ